MTTTDKCNGEIESAGYRKLSDPVRAGMEYNSQCLTCARWAGYASENAADMQEFIDVQILSQRNKLRLCENWLEKPLHNL